MKKLGWVGVIAGVLLLAGCAAPGGQALEVAPPVALDDPTSVLTAEPEAPTAAEDTFVTAIQRIPGLENAEPEAAIATGEAVCSQLEEGVSPLDIAAVEGDSTINNDDAIRLASQLICPAHETAVYEAFVAEYEINPPQS